MQGNKAVVKAINHAGGKHELAELCGVTRQGVDYWLRYGIRNLKTVKRVSKKTGIPIEEFVK